VKLTKTLIASALFLATSSLAIAATDSTNIEINVTKDAYVNLIGDLQGNVVKTLALADLNATTTTLGTLGTESNTTGTCDVAFTSDNDFRLVHGTDAALYLHGANKYTIDWEGTTISSGGTSTVNLLTCNNVASNFEMTSPALPAVVIAGTYKDILHVTVTTQ